MIHWLIDDHVPLYPGIWTPSVLTMYKSLLLIKFWYKKGCHIKHPLINLHYCHVYPPLYHYKSYVFMIWQPHAFMPCLGQLFHLGAVCVERQYKTG